MLGGDTDSRGKLNPVSALDPAIHSRPALKRPAVLFDDYSVHIAHIGGFLSFTVFTISTMVLTNFLATFVGLILTASVSAQGLYSKGSAVLQVDGKSYQKLVAKSNQVSVCFQAV